MELELYVRRMGRRAARYAEFGGAASVLRVHAEMCTQVAAAHGFQLDEVAARAFCAAITPALTRTLVAEEAVEDEAVDAAPAAEPARTRALSIATLTHALAYALQAWLRAIGFVERRGWTLEGSQK